MIVLPLCQNISHNYSLCVFLAINFLLYFDHSFYSKNDFLSGLILNILLCKYISLDKCLTFFLENTFDDF